MLRQGTRPALAHTQNLARQCRRANSTGLWSSSSSVPPSPEASTSKPASARPPNRKVAKKANNKQEVRQELRKVAKDIADKQRKKKDPGLWRGPMQQPDKTLRDLVAPVNPQEYISQEKENFLLDQVDASLEDAVFAGGDPNLGLEDVQILPGAFIATRRNDMTTLGIVLGFRFHGGRESIVMFTPTGEIWYPFREDVTFLLPSYVSPNITSRCGFEEMAQSETELNARKQVLRSLRELVHELEVKSNVRHLGPELWHKLKSPDPNAWAEVTVGEVARLIDPTPKYHAIFAAHLFLMNNSLQFVAKHPYLITQTFNVRPQAEVELIQKLYKWKREDDPRLVQFAEKARPIIAQTSKRVQESALEPPTQHPAPPVWNEDDKTILQFLKMSLRQTRSNQADPYLVPRSAIMRMLDPTHLLFMEDDLAKLLVNLGLFSPWQDVTVIQAPTVEPEYNPESPYRKRQEKIAERSLARLPSPSAPLGPEDFYPSDPLEPVRHDFGDATVFVIDDASARELDDGVSIESIPSEPGSYWLHAHIANPTATLPPTHIFAIDAMKQGVTQYFQHHTVPLFPSSLMYHPETGWSLNSQKGKASRVITFSSKIDNKGQLVDYKVRAGLINNVRVISYEAANKILGYDPVASGDITRPFGGPGLTLKPVEVPELPDNEVQALRTLYKVTRTLQDAWCQTYVARPTPVTARVIFGEFPSGSMTPSTDGRTFRGFPEFKDYVVSSPTSLDRGSQGLVQEVMKLAGRVGSKFALDHNVPMIRRSMAAAPLLTPELTDELKALRSEAGSVGFWHAVPRIAGMYPAQYTLEPREHYHVGAAAGEGYSRVTSPLRRALDLVGHWQLHRVLLGKHADSQKPMFDVDRLDQFKVEFGIIEGLNTKIGNYHGDFWVAQFLKRWKNGQLRGDGFAAYDPNRTYDGFALTKGMPMYHKNAKNFSIAVPELGLMANLEAPLPYETPIGVKVGVKLADVALKIKSGVTFMLED